MKTLNQLYTCLTILVISVSAQAQRGGIDSGGGTLVINNQQKGLLDLYLHAPEIYQDTTDGQDNVLKTKAYQMLGVDRITNRTNPITLKTVQKLTEWKQQSPIFIQDLEDAIMNLPLYMHKAEIKSAPIKYYLPATAKTENLKMVALYSSQIGVHVGAKDFASLSEKNQMALVIHEAIRHLNSASGYQISDQDLQSLTARIMQGPQNKSDSLDQSKYLKGARQQELASALKAKTSAQNALAIYYKNLGRPSQILKLKSLSSEELKNETASAFEMLYLKDSAQISKSERQSLSDLYLAMTRLENSNIESLLQNSKLTTAYLKQRTDFLYLDLIIDQVNTDAASVDSELVRDFRTVVEAVLAAKNLELK